MNSKPISFEMAEGRIFVSDGTATYSVASEDEAPSWTGNGSGMSYREAMESNCLAVWDDEVDGDSSGLHGHLYVK
jgi:hypothetical protein